jgi:hypothetical protein
VEHLLLDGNYLQQQAAKYISKLMIKNEFITELVSMNYWINERKIYSNIVAC